MSIDIDARKIFSALIVMILISTIPSSGKIQVSTYRLVFEVSPGGSSSKRIEVENTGSTKADVEIEILDWTMNKKGKVNLGSKGPKNDHELSPWLDCVPETFKLRPGETKDLNLSVSLPSEVDGTHWTMLFVKEKAVSTEKQGNVAVPISMAYGVKVFQFDPSDLNPSGNIVQLEMKNDGDSNLEEFMQLTFKNRGNVPLRPSGYIEIRDTRGNKKSNLKVKSFTVLPESERLLRIPLKEELSSGSYVAIAVLDFGGELRVAKQVKFDI